MRSIRLGLVAAAVTLHLHPTVAVAEPIHLLSGAKCESTATGEEFELPPGFFLPEPEWEELDVEVKRLQEQEVRLEAENEVYRETHQSWWAPLVLGIGAGLLASYM